jgi:methionyl-tRNA formyltransferase
VKVVFFGTASFAVPSLEAICSATRHELAAVVTGPDKVAGRGLSLKATPVGLRAAELGMGSLLKPDDLSAPSFIADLKSLSAEVFVVVAYRILPDAVFTMPRFAFNLHASLLPAYRGAAPIQRAIMAGETVTGVTTFLLERRVDAGAILGRREAAISPGETAGALAERLSFVGADLVLETLDGLASGVCEPQRQDATRRSRAPKIGPADQRLDFAQGAAELVNRVRALAPRPGAVAQFRGRVVKIMALAETQSGAAEAASGTVVRADPKGGLEVATGDHTVTIERIQPNGKKEQSGTEFVRGYRVEEGDRFESVG